MWLVIESGYMLRIRKTVSHKHIKKSTNSEHAHRRYMHNRHWEDTWGGRHVDGWGGGGGIKRISHMQYLLKESYDHFLCPP